METQGERKPLSMLTEEEVRARHALFDKYITPNLNLVYSCVKKYSMDKSYVDDNYVEALVNFYNYIDTYNPSRPLPTWIHIVTKRFVHNHEMKRVRAENVVDDKYATDPDDLVYELGSDITDIDLDNWRELFDDDMLRALYSLKPIYLEALLLQVAGYKLNEIVEISYVNGNLPSKSIDTVKSRLFLAKTHLRNMLSRDGSRKNDKEIPDCLF